MALVPSYCANREKRLRSMVEPDALALSILGGALPDAVEWLSASLLSQLPAGSKLSATFLYKLPGFLEELAGTSLRDPGIVDHYGRTNANMSPVLDFLVNQQFITPPANRARRWHAINFLHPKFQLEETKWVISDQNRRRLLRVEEQFPDVGQTAGLVDELSRYPVRDLMCVSDWLLCENRRDPGALVPDIISKVQTVSLRDFRHPSEPTMPRDTITFNLHRTLRRRALDTGSVAFPRDLLTVDELGLESLQSFLVQPSPLALPAEAAGVELKDLVINGFAVVEAASIGLACLGGALKTIDLVWLLTCRAHLEEFDKAERTDEYLRFMIDQVRFHVDRLVETGFLVRVEREFVAPAASAFEDEHGDTFYVWDPRTARARLDYFERRAREIRKQGILGGTGQ
jgi:hypothetical protein